MTGASCSPDILLCIARCLDPSQQRAQGPIHRVRESPPRPCAGDGHMGLEGKGPCLTRGHLPGSFRASNKKMVSGLRRPGTPPRIGKSHLSYDAANWAKEASRLNHARVTVHIEHPRIAATRGLRHGSGNSALQELALAARFMDGACIVPGCVHPAARDQAYTGHFLQGPAHRSAAESKCVRDFVLAAFSRFCQQLVNRL